MRIRSLRTVPNRAASASSLKRSAKPEDMYDAADLAVVQIKEKRYTALLYRLWCCKQYVYGIAFCRKDGGAVSGGSVDAVK